MKRIDAGEFEEAIGKIILGQIDSKFKQIAIDGKSVRSTYEILERFLHLVSACLPTVIITYLKDNI